MTACAYRSLEPVLVQRLTDLRERRERDASLVQVARGVASRRIGRAIGGAVGVAAAAVMFLLATTSFLWESQAKSRAQAASTLLLLLAWPIAAAATLVARRVVRSSLSRDAREPMSGDPAADLAVLQARDPLRDTCATAMRWERRSAALPLAAISLLAPLTLHWLVWQVLRLPETPGLSAEEFGVWIGISGIVVGHAHVALLLYAAVDWTGKLRLLPTDSLRARLGRTWGIAVAWAVGVAAVPGVVLLAVPPLLAAVTAMAFVPLMFILTARCIQKERLVLEAT
jgi:hypothetical protein